MPVVNIGTRQAGRTRAENIRDVGHDKEEIKGAIQKQIAHGPYAPSLVYYKPGTAQRIAEILKAAPLYTQKRFHDAV